MSTEAVVPDQQSHETQACMRCGSWFAPEDKLEVCRDCCPLRIKTALNCPNDQFDAEELLRLAESIVASRSMDTELARRFKERRVSVVVFTSVVIALLTLVLSVETFEASLLAFDHTAVILLLGTVQTAAMLLLIPLSFMGQLTSTLIANEFMLQPLKDHESAFDSHSQSADRFRQYEDLGLFRTVVFIMFANALIILLLGIVVFVASIFATLLGQTKPILELLVALGFIILVVIPINMAYLWSLNRIFRQAPNLTIFQYLSLAWKVTWSTSRVNHHSYLRDSKFQENLNFKEPKSLRRTVTIHLVRSTILSLSMLRLSQKQPENEAAPESGTV